MVKQNTPQGALDHDTCGICLAQGRGAKPYLIEAGRKDLERLGAKFGTIRWGATRICRTCLAKPTIVEDAVAALAAIFSERDRKADQEVRNDQ